MSRAKAQGYDITMASRFSSSCELGLKCSSICRAAAYVASTASLLRICSAFRAWLSHITLATGRSEAICDGGLPVAITSVPGLRAILARLEYVSWDRSGHRSNQPSGGLFS